MSRMDDQVPGSGGGNKDEKDVLRRQSLFLDQKVRFLQKSIVEERNLRKDRKMCIALNVVGVISCVEEEGGA